MTELLTALAVIFILAGPVLLVANRLHVSAIPALLVAGLIAGLFIDEQLTLELARLGIALLVFTFSVKIHTESIRTVVSDSEIVAIVQAIVVGVLGIGLAILLGLDVTQGVYVGIAAALSSTIIGTTLFQSPYRDIVRERLSASIHSVQDYLAVFVLIVLGAGTVAADPIAMEIGYGVLLLALAIVVNRYFFGWIRQLSGGSDESMLVGVVALLIGFLALAEFVELSIVVGAFAAGIAVRDDPVVYSEVLNGLASIKDFFAAIFFVTVGALVTIPSGQMLLVVATLVILVGVIKPAVIVALLVYKGYERRSATLTGLDLDHVGEFGIIVAIEAFVLGILLESVFEAIILAAAISMVISSITRYYDEQIYRALVRYGLLGRPYHRVDDWNTVPDDLADHIVIVGYGRQGHRLVQFCEEHDQPYVVIENNPALLDELRSECDAYVFGDVIERDTCSAANLSEAKLVISTAVTRPVTDHLLSFSDSVDVIVRTNDVIEAPALIDRGAIYVSVADLLAADKLRTDLKALVEGEYERGQLYDRWVAEFGSQSNKRFPRRLGGRDGF